MNIRINKTGSPDTLVGIFFDSDGNGDNFISIQATPNSRSSSMFVDLATAEKLYAHLGALLTDNAITQEGGDK